MFLHRLSFVSTLLFMFFESCSQCHEFHKNTFFVKSIIKRTKNYFSPSNIQPFRAVVVQPMQFNSITSSFADRKTVTLYMFNCTGSAEL